MEYGQVGNAGNDNFRKYMEFQYPARPLPVNITDPPEVAFTTFDTISFGTIDGQFCDFLRGKQVYRQYPPELFLQSALQ